MSSRHTRLEGWVGGVHLDWVLEVEGALVNHPDRVRAVHGDEECARSDVQASPVTPSESGPSVTLDSVSEIPVAHFSQK